MATQVGDVAVLTADLDEAVAFAALDQALAAPLLLLRTVTGPGRLALVHPGTGRYLTGSPLATPTGPIAAADTLKSWEWFTPRAVSDLSVQAGAVRRLALMRTLLESGLDADSLARFILSGQEGTAHALNAALAMIETATLDTLAERVVTDAALRTALAQLYPKDPWAGTALPDLAAWRGKPPPHSPGFLARLLRGTPRTDAAPAAPARRRVIGPGFDVLGASGTLGDFASLPHACNARARRMLPPGEGVAVLATARNEGIYLLEWIAHHRRLGARAIYIYSNDNQDGSDTLLGALADAGVITWIDSRLGSGTQNAQFKAYGHALGCMPDLLACEWVLIVDIDEFLFLDRARFVDLDAFAGWHRRRGADTVAINWQFMAPEESGDPCAVPLTRRNLRVLRMEHCGEGVRLVKSLSRPNRVAHSEAHVPYSDERSRITTDHASGAVHEWHRPPDGFSASPKFADRIMDGPAVINHYFYKSAAEWLWKQSRNRGDHALQRGEAARPMGAEVAREYLRQLEAAGLIRDERALATSLELEKEMCFLSALPRVAEALARVQDAFGARQDTLRRMYTEDPDTRAWGEESQRFLRLARYT